MKNPDLSALWRSSVGFDRMLDVIDDAFRWTDEENDPPYDIEKTGDDKYRISLAVAGYSPDEIAVTAEQNVLTVEGRKADKEDREYLYRGISQRPFRHVFNLADFVEVRKASFESGLLQIDLERQVPETMKPRRVPISAGNAPAQIQGKKAA